MVELPALRQARGLTRRQLGQQLVPPVSVSYIGQLETGAALASPSTLFDLARIFGSIQLEDELGHRYTLVYRGQVPPPLSPDIDWT